MTRLGKLILSLVLAAGALVIVPTAAGSAAPYVVTITGGTTTVEGSAATIQLTVGLDSPSDGDAITLTFGGDAGNPADISGPASVTVVAGQQQAFVSYTVIDDDLVEGDETFTVTATGANVTSSDTASITIEDDPAGSLSVTAVPPSVEEGEATDVTVTRTGGTEGPRTVNLSLPDVTQASFPGSAPSAVVLLPHSPAGGVQNGAATLTTAENGADDGDRAVEVTATEALTPIAGSPVSVAILDDDDPSGVAVVEPASIPEGGSAEFTFTRTGSLTGEVKVTLTVDPPLSVTGDSDGGVLGEVTWGNGESGPRSVTVAAPNDDLFNQGVAADYDVVVTGAPAGVTGADGSVSIANNDAQPGVEVVSVPDSVLEGGAAQQVVLKRTGAIGHVVSATVAVVGGPGAISGPGTVSWLAGESVAVTKSVNVIAPDNGVYGGDRTITLSIGTESVFGSGTVSGSSDRTVTAVDDESRVSFDDPDIVINETRSSVRVDVVREGTVGAVTARLELFPPDGLAPADEGEDYEAPSSSQLSLSWGDGQAGIRTLVIELEDPVADAGSEYLGVRFDSVSGALVGSPDETIIRLRDIPNNAPSGTPDGPSAATSTAEGTPVSIDVLANDSDPDGHRLSLLAGSGSVTGGSFSCLAGPGAQCTFSPVAGFVGSASFTYEASDGLATTGPTTVTVVVGDGDEACSTEPGELGTAGADDIVGDDDQDEILCGLGGNDQIAGGGGADLLRGGPGDDTLVIEGGDSLDGGTGADVGVLNLGSGRDEVDVRDGEIIVNGEVVSFESLSELRLNLGGGNDSVVVTPSSVAIDIVGGGGFDRLTYNSGGLTGVVESSDSIEADGVAPVTFSQLEVVETDDRRFIGTTGADQVRVTGISQDLLIDLLGSGDLLEVTFGALDGLLTVQDTGAGGVDELIAIDDDSSSQILVTSGAIVIDGERVDHDGIERVEVLGTGGDDVITVEAAGLAAAASSPVVAVDGGTGTDRLIVEAGGLDASVDVVAGVVEVEGRTPISFSRVEFVQVVDSPSEIPVTATSGYWMLEANGVIHPFGAAADLDDAPVSGSAVDLVPTPDGQGLWVLDSGGGVYALGTAPFFGSAAGTTLGPGETYEAISPTPSGQGYWIFTSRGRVLTFGDASFHGDLLDLALNGPVIDAVPTVSGNGYWMLGTDGGVFALGDAEFYGSTGDIVLNEPAVGLVPDPDGVGYWFVATDGGVFAYQAEFLGSMGGTPLNQPVNGMIPYGNGYLLVASDGGVFVYSDLPFVGSLGDDPPPNPIVGIAAPQAP